MPRCAEGEALTTGRRLLICRPLGGLNDLLCQIERACRYGERFGREVVVDTNHPSTTYFHDDFSSYFESLQPGLVLEFAGLAPGCDAGDVVPAFLAHRPSGYSIRFDRALSNFVRQSRGCR